MSLSQVMTFLAICCVAASLMAAIDRGQLAVEPASQSASQLLMASTPAADAPTPLATPLSPAAVRAAPPDGPPRWESRGYITIALAALPTIILLAILGMVVLRRRKRAS